MPLLRAPQVWSRIPPRFSLFQLSWAGYLESHLSRFSDLDNEIHPIFRIENFDIPTHQYGSLTPAFRFASLLITNEHCMDWWVSVYFGRLSTVVRLPAPTGKKNTFNTYNVLDPVSSVTREHISATREALLDLANKISFRFSVDPKP